jgi:hypothetical protein
LGLSLELSGQPAEWLKAQPDAELVNAVLDFLQNDLCEDPDSVDGIAVPHSRFALSTVQVPETDVAVTWFEAHPFRCVRVLKIELIADRVSEDDSPEPTS